MIFRTIQDICSSQNKVKHSLVIIGLINTRFVSVMSSDVFDVKTIFLELASIKILIKSGKIYLMIKFILVLYFNTYFTVLRGIVWRLW